jgi:hypothetical protein
MQHSIILHYYHSTRTPVKKEGISCESHNLISRTESSSL